MFLPNELILVRHAEPDNKGRLCGRTDIGITDKGVRDLEKAAPYMPENPVVYASPARRCQETAKGLFPSMVQKQRAQLWEQDFGDWEGQPFSSLPDIGVLSRDELAQTPVPGGESFADVAARAEPVLQNAAAEALAGGPIVVVAHAGIVRVALSMALGVVSAGLAFQIAPLSFTRLQCLPDGKFAIGAVGWTAV